MSWTTDVRIVLVLVTVAAGCTTGKDLAQSTRTGKIHDIRIGQSIEPREIEVRPGDEVRWINARNAPVRVVFIDTLKDQVSCQKHFKLTTKTTVSNISPNDYSSLCFLSPGAYTYNARMESTAPGGEENAVGRVYVDGTQRPAS